MTTSSLDTIKAREESLLCRTYGRYPVSIASGKGSRVTDLDGKEYVDLLAGIAVTSLGHSGHRETGPQAHPCEQSLLSGRTA